MRPLLQPSHRKTSSPRQANHLHRCSAISTLPVPLSCSNLVGRKGRPYSGSSAPIVLDRSLIDQGRFFWPPWPPVGGHLDSENCSRSLPHNQGKTGVTPGRIPPSRPVRSQIASWRSVSPTD